MFNTHASGQAWMIFMVHQVLDPVPRCKQGSQNIMCSFPCEKKCNIYRLHCIERELVVYSNFKTYLKVYLEYFRDS